MSGVFQNTDSIHNESRVHLRFVPSNISTLQGNGHQKSPNLSKNTNKGIMGVRGRAI